MAPRILTATTVAAALTAVAQADTTFVPIQADRTFLHTSEEDPAPPAVAIAIDTLGLAPGDRVRMDRVGDWANGINPDELLNVIGVFSSDDVILDRGETYRIPGALEAGGPEIETTCTFFGCEHTDFPEDFSVYNGTFGVDWICVCVPEGATHLFLSTLDSFYSDNTDADGDLGVDITPLALGDVNCDGVVNVDDLLAVFAGWGTCPGDGAPCHADVDYDGDVDVVDMLAVLGDWD